MSPLCLLPARCCVLGTAPPQTTPAPARNPGLRQAKASRTQPADRRAAAHKGPKVVGNSQELGQRILQKSKPTDMLQRPVK